MQRLIPILILLGGLTSLTIDINLPALAEIATAFAVTPEKVQWLLSAFMLSFALGQLAFGPISDRFGRKPPLLAGIVIYGFANGLSLMAERIEVLIVAWFLLGLGACAGAVGWVSIVRDLFEEREMTRAMARISAFIGIGSVIAPIAGAFLTRSFGWTSGPFVLLSLTIILLAWVVWRLPETNPRQTGAMRQSMLADYGAILGNRSFLLYSAINILAFAGLFSFIVSASPLLIGGFGLGPRTFGFLFASNAAIYVAGGFLTARLAGMISRPALVLIGSFFMLLGGVIMAALAASGQPAALMAPMYLATLGSALMMPTGVAGGLAPFGKNAGAAAAVQGSLRFGIASAVGMILGFFPLNATAPLAVTITFCGLASFALARVIRAENLKTAPVARPHAAHSGPAIKDRKVFQRLAVGLLVFIRRL